MRARLYLLVHTAPGLPSGSPYFFSDVALRPQRPYGLFGTGAHVVHLTDGSHSSWALLSLRVQCCCTSTEIVWTIRDGEPRTSTSTFSQLLRSALPASLLLFSVALRPEKPYGLLRTGSPRRLPRLSHSSCALKLQFIVRSILLYVDRDRTDY